MLTFVDLRFGDFLRLDPSKPDPDGPHRITVADKHSLASGRPSAMSWSRESTEYKATDGRIGPQARVVTNGDVRFPAVRTTALTSNHLTEFGRPGRACRASQVAKRPLRD